MIMMKSSVVTTCLLLVSTSVVVQGFAVLPMMARRPTTTTTSPLFLYVEEYSSPPPSTVSTTTTEMERRVQECLSANNNNKETTMALLQELEELQNDCTEEGNQTDDECDIIQKGNRDYWIKLLEDSLLDESSSSTSKLEEQVIKCLSGKKTFAPKQIRSLMEQLEELNAECTEDSNQLETNEECDVSIKFQRDDWIQQLDEMLIMEEEQPTIKSSSSTTLSTASLSELMSLLDKLEQTSQACTEEGNQTNDECDIDAMADRLELMELVSHEILQKQTQTTSATKLCMQYNLCETTRLRQTLADLETLNSLCTEEGNQTRSFCSLEAKEERDQIINTLRTQLELADNVVAANSNKSKNRSVFQI